MALSLNVFAAIDTTTAPWTDLSSVPLSISSSNLSVRLMWPETSPALSLQVSTDMASWEPVTPPAVATNGNFEAGVALPNQSAFFRLSAAAVFVAPPPFGNDTNPGTRLQPMATLAQGISAAAALHLPVFVAKGTYSETLLQPGSVSLFGQFDGTTSWTRAASNTTTIVGGEMGVLLSGITHETHFEGFDVRASASFPGHSAYGIVISNPAAPLVVRFNTVTAGDGVAGQNGVPGTDGANGGNGAAGNVGACGLDISAPGGAGGASGAIGVINNAGGAGGAGSYNQQNGLPGTNGFGAGPGTGGAGGNWGNPGNFGFNGEAGSAVANATNGVSGTGGSFSGVVWTTAAGTGGGDGPDGNGGGGGGGGGGRSCRFCVPGTGNGGGGGEGGRGATPGTGGGGSFGIVILAGNTNSPVVIDNNAIATGVGGTGGNGATGGAGGLGGIGGAGAIVCPTDVGIGGNGGNGSAGANGGASGAGAGGPSIGIYGAGFARLGTNNVFTIGSGGTGGTSPVGPGGNGLSSEVQ